jgi:bifunctional non-homologous end joining protein LigD
MLASLIDAPLEHPKLVYEPKYDGIRVIAEVDPAGAVRLWSRLGNEKSGQFPEIVTALQKWARRLKVRVVLDGEVVALDDKGEPAGFQQLQGRIHLSRGRGSRLPVAFIAFDVLREGRTDFRERPLLERREALERIFGRASSPMLRVSQMVRADGRALYRRALEQGWEGLIAKDADSPYKSGKRMPYWRKLKITHEQEFVVGGWTEPRQTRTYFGALLLGVYTQAPAARASSLVYVGHTGTGFNERELARLMKLLKPLETKGCPFRERPRTNEKPHWVRPKLVAQVKFTEWTADGRLRHPVYLGLRDDKKAEDVRREPTSRLHAGSALRASQTASGVRLPPSREASAFAEASGDPKAATALGWPAGGPQRGSRIVLASRSLGRRGQAHPGRLKPAATRFETDPGGAEARAPGTDDLLQQLRDIETSRRDGVLLLPEGDRLKVSSLHKVFWPKQKLTKGDLMRYYVQVAPFILPTVDGRPLVMKRFPNGITGQAFYQQRAPEGVPEGVRVEVVGDLKARDSRGSHAARPRRKASRSDDDVLSRIIGGNLKTLLYMTQLAAISQDPWFSRVSSPASADYAALDLDPMPNVSFARVLDVARWIRDELDFIGATGVPKTSGADGLHIYLPLPAGTPYDAGLLFCQIVATIVANKHPKVATIERAVRARGSRVYIDYLQNIPGKTLATAYSARASDYAGVSTPLGWREIDEGVKREQFTIETAPARIRKVGDLWAELRKAKGVDLSRVSRYRNDA